VINRKYVRDAAVRVNGRRVPSTLLSTALEPTLQICRRVSVIGWWLGSSAVRNSQDLWIKSVRLLQLMEPTVCCVADAAGSSVAGEQSERIE
jgi:hypothetical protein